MIRKVQRIERIYQRHGRVAVTSSNCEDKSLAHWAHKQRRYYKIESRIKFLNAIGFVWSLSEGRGSMDRKCY